MITGVKPAAMVIGVKPAMSRYRRRHRDDGRGPGDANQTQMVAETGAEGHAGGPKTAVGQAAGRVAARQSLQEMIRGGSPLSYHTFTRAPGTAKPPIDAATPHGWRSVFKRWAGDISDDTPRELAEAGVGAFAGLGRGRVLA